MSNFNLKHLFHVSIFCSIIALAQTFVYLHHRESLNKKQYEQYNEYFTEFLNFIQYLVILPLPMIASNFLGLILFDAFPDKISVKNKQQGDSPLKPNNIPHLCFRIVTRGLYPELVQSNVNKNFLTCIEAGLNNFSVEVVTDKEMSLTNRDPKVRQIVVPTSYRTSTGAMFKARALQYALERDVSPVAPGDYIVHLDEETIVTPNVVNGIINFAIEGKHQFGQGLITYTNLEIVNWFTTLADFFRVAEDMGKLRFQFMIFHKPIFGWKGSFVVCRYEAEKDVTFDHGRDGSISEDCYFAMIAFKKGYSFDFIQGEMWERSPFSILDLIRQRKRWFQGVWLVVHSSAIPLKNKLVLTVSLYAWATLPLVGVTYIINTIFPVPAPFWIGSVGTFCFAVSIYMYMFGVIKSFDLKETGRGMVFVYLVAAVLSIPFNLVMEDIAIVWGLFGSKHNFYIVDKNVNRKVILDA